MRLSEIREKMETELVKVSETDKELGNALKESIANLEKWFNSEIEFREEEIGEKEDEIDDLEDDVKKLEEEIEKLEDQAQEFPIQTLEDEMKVELLQVLFNQYSLRELEEKIGGNKFTL